MKLTDLLGKKPLFFDGAMGTVLQSKGLLAGELSDTWNITRPDDIYGVHAAYLHAGADIINTNTFVTSRLKHDNAAEIAEAGAKLARRAVTDFGYGFVAFDVGPTGLLMKPSGPLGFEEAVSIYSEVIAAGAPYCDCVMIETMSDLYEVKAAVIAAKESCSLPVFVTVTMDKTHRTLSGADAKTVVTVLEGLGVSAIGLNCGLGPDTMAEILPEFVECATVPVIITPNAGLPDVDGDSVHYHVSPDDFADAVADIIRGGAAVVGGCCGTSFEYIKRIREVCGSLSLASVENKPQTRVASGSATVTWGERPVVIGERINPTGKPNLKAALRNSDFEYLLGMAYSELDAGADVLDVNCGLPDIDECVTLTTAVEKIGAAVKLPLSLDSSDPVAMESALRIYNGKPLINSVNGKSESMHAIFPLVKKYGGVVIGLLLDENGIPDTVDGRMAIAERIVSVAAEYGIGKHDIIIDTLTMAAATVDGAAEVTLNCVERCRRELGVHTVLGVSNISFGLPIRDTVNAAFFTLALSRGLSSAIINPESAQMMGALRAYMLLCGIDRGGIGYSRTYADTDTKAVTAKASMALTMPAAILGGRRADAARIAEKLAETTQPLDIINGHIIPGLTRLGDEYDKNRIFLPQLLAGAEAATAAFDVVKSRIGAAAESRGTVILATVRGDVHDIGKNIVRALLENYGYDVHDLGRDVPIEVVVDEVTRTNAPLLGLSALMTTTVPAMRDTIAAVRDAAPYCRIMVGGAVLTQSLADMIGADFYAPEATASVRYANEVFGHRTDF